MNKKIYLGMQLKRGLKLYPSILIITFILVAGILLSAFAVMHTASGDEKKQIIKVGVVGNVDDTYLGIGVYAIKNMDSSRFYIDLVEMSEDEAILALEKRKIAGYVFIPDGFVKSITQGKNNPLTYVTNDDPDGFGNIIENEIVMMVSDLVTESQKSIYAAIKLARDTGSDKELNKKIDKLNLSYINYALNREKTYELVLTGVQDDLSYGGYYICAIIAFFLMIWGISCNSLLAEKNYDLQRLVSVRGIGAFYQVFTKLFCFFALTVLTALIFGFAFGIVASNFDLGVAETETSNAFSASLFVIKIIPVTLMFAAMHVMLYEVFSASVGSIFIQFIIAIGLGYVSGIFYPNTFFPESVQEFASYLPSGAGFSYIRKNMSGISVLHDLKLVVAYTAGFYLVSVFLRSCKIKGDGII